jgi:hypothetical protein
MSPTTRRLSKSLMMRAALPLTLLTLAAGCAPTFEARVARFSALPAPAQQSFSIESRDPQKSGGLEFATYANLVRQRLTSVGYAEARSPSDASLIVLLDYNVGPPRERVETRYSGYGGFGYGGWGYRGGGFGRWGYGGFGWNPYWGGFGYGTGFGYPEVYSVTQYNAQLAMKIVRASDQASVFEGRAETVSDTNNLTKLVPNLVTAIFTNFPGNSGETVSVKFDPSQPGKPAAVKPIR